MTQPAPSIEQLQQELADARNLINALQKEGKSAKAYGLRKSLKKLGASIAAAFSTPEAIKAEKYLAVVALTRLAILLPSAAGVVLVIVKLLGGPDTGVTP
jgi:hypothetical protein